MPALDTEVIIIGAGLSGLTAGWQLKKLGIDYRIVEARDRTGGRILSASEYGGHFDLGPSWIWPGQHQVARLLNELNLDIFDQPVIGATLYQLQGGEIQQHQGLSPMAGAYRIKGGSVALTNALTELLAPDNTIYLDHRCIGVSATDQGVQLHLTHGTSTTHWTATTIAMATPPRLAAKLTYSPTLPSKLVSALQNLPTWMAGHAKAIALFETPFWREQGLSGTVMSQVGPLVEMHDASAFDGGPYALFGFVGYPASARQQIGDTEIISLVKQQLVSIFGSVAQHPIGVMLQDWSKEPFTTDEQDLTNTHGHPAYGLSINTEADWANRLHFISTETNHDNGGLIEGAVDRAMQFTRGYSKQR